jgi:hypothetical protein
MDQFGLMYYNGCRYPEAFDQRQYQQINSHLSSSGRTGLMLNGGFSPFGGMYPSGLGIMGQAGLGDFGYGYSSIAMNSGPYGLMGAGGNWAQPYGGSMVLNREEAEVNLARAGASFNGRCYFCGRLGHRKVDCVKLKSELQAQRNRKRFKNGSRGVAKSFRRDRIEKQDRKNVFYFEDFEEICDVDEFDDNRLNIVEKLVKPEVRSRGLKQDAKTVLKVDAEGGQKSIMVVSKPVDDMGLSKSEASVLVNFEIWNSVEKNSVEKNSVEKNSLEKNSVEKNSVEKNSVEKNSVEKNSVEENSVEKNSVEKNSVEENSVEKNSVVKNSVEKNSVEKNSVEKNSVEKNSVEKNSVEKNSVEKNSVEENSVEKNSVEKNSVEENSVEKNSVEENPIGVELALISVKELCVKNGTNLGIGSGWTRNKWVVKVGLENEGISSLCENLDPDPMLWLVDKPSVDQVIKTIVIDVLSCLVAGNKVREVGKYINKLKSKSDRVDFLVNGLERANEKQTEHYNKVGRNSSKLDFGDLIIVLNSRNKPNNSNGNSLDGRVSQEGDDDEQWGWKSDRWSDQALENYFRESESGGSNQVYNRSFVSIVASRSSLILHI